MFSKDGIPKRATRAFLVSAVLVLSACESQNGDRSPALDPLPNPAPAPTQTAEPAPTPTPTTTPTPTPTPTVTSTPVSTYSSYLTPYAAAHKASANHHWDAAWSQAVMDAIPAELLSARVPQDVTDVCPDFFGMSDLEKKSFWAYFFQAISVAESALDPTDRYVESGLGNDPVTGKQVVSEGLLQLSYGDSPHYSCGFDWSKDKLLSTTDRTKTIFDPILNLKCGVKIFKHQVIDAGLPVFPSKNYYWSTLTRGKAGYDRVVSELKLVPPFCVK